MGRSLQEQRADDMFKYADSDANQAIGVRTAEAQSRLSTGLSELDKNFEAGKNLIHKTSATRLQGVGKQMGEMLASQGIAPGHDSANAWIASQAPIIAEETNSIANLLNQKANIGSNMRMQSDAQLAQIIQQLLQNASSQKQNALALTKDSTELGDAMSVIMPIAQLALAVGTGGASLPFSSVLSGLQTMQTGIESNLPNQGYTYDPADQSWNWRQD